MFYPSFGTKQVEIFLFIKLKSAILIRNMKQYLLASLYNAPTTMQLSYQNQTNHDLAMRR